MKHREGKRQLDAYQVYLEMGYDRSLRKLVAVLGQTWGSAAPSQTSVECWSSWFGWAAKVQVADADAQMEREKVWRRRKAREQLDRVDERLALAKMKRSMVYNALAPADVPIDLMMVDPVRLRAIDSLNRTAEETERLDLGQPPHIVESSGRDSQPLLPATTQLQILGREALVAIWDFLDPSMEIVGGDAPSLKREEQAVIDHDSGVILDFD